MPRYLLLFLCVVLGLGLFVALKGQPSPPGQPQAASGSITILVNGIPVATGGTINLKSGNGVIASASPDAALNGTDIHFDADLGVMLSSQADQDGQTRSFTATSNFPFPAPQSPPDGLHYTATMMPPVQSYKPLQAFVMAPDVASLPQATVNLGPGPIAIQGTCSPPACILVAVGSPVNAFVVH